MLYLTRVNRLEANSIIFKKSFLKNISPPVNSTLVCGGIFSRTDISSLWDLFGWRLFLPFLQQIQLKLHVPPIPIVRYSINIISDALKLPPIAAKVKAEMNRIVRRILSIVPRIDCIAANFTASSYRNEKAR